MRGLAILTASAACTAIADFPEDRLSESNAALCGNFVDDDLDGLTDCQDWKCLDEPACCRIPVVVLEDDFAERPCASSACEEVPSADQRATCGPDVDRWARWGAPDPYLCDGALRFAKEELCYPTGVLSHALVALAPGFRLETDVEGVPEEAAYLEVGLTTAAVAVGGSEPCLDIFPSPTLFKVIYAADPEGGVRFAAVVEGIGIAEVHADGAGPHEIAITVDADGRVVFAVDEQPPFATSSEVLPAEPGIDAHVILRGLGSDARFESLVVVEGTQCETPTQWTRAEPFAPVDPPQGEATWDSFQRGYPNARVDEDDGTLHLSYTGCQAAANPICDPFTLAVGEALAPPGGELERSPEPLFLTSDASDGNPILEWAPVGDEGYTGQIDWGHYIGHFAVDADGGLNELEPAIERTDDTAWDRVVSRPFALDSGETRFLWYAGLPFGLGARSQIGLVRFIGEQRIDSGEPMLPFGEAGEFDEQGVADPMVVHDEHRALYRMWYLGFGTFGQTAIGYAVSTDGITWSKYPGNPVIRPADLGLLTIGAPTVIDDDGRLVMWVHGTEPGATGATIYQLENLGAPFVAPP